MLRTFAGALHEIDRKLVRAGNNVLRKSSWTKQNQLIIEGGFKSLFTANRFAGKVEFSLSSPWHLANVSLLRKAFKSEKLNLFFLRSLFEGC